MLHQESPAGQSSANTKSSWMQFSIRGLLIVTVLGALIAYQFRPRDVTADLQFVSFNAPRKVVTFRLTNTARNAIWFTGYSLDSPLYTSATRTAKGWEDEIGGWCGTGADLRRLPEGQSTEFSVWLLDETADAIQVQVHCSDGTKDGNGKLISSERIELATGKVLPRTTTSPVKIAQR